MFEVGLVQLTTRLFQHAHRDRNAVVSEDLDPPTSHERIGIHRSNHDAVNSLFDNQTDTGRGLSMVGAGLQAHIEGCPSCLPLAGLERIDLGMGAPKFPVVTPCYDGSSPNDQGAHHRVWANPSQAFSGESKGLFHVESIVQRYGVLHPGTR